MSTLTIGGADLSFTGGKWTSAPSGTILQTLTATMREDQTVSATSWTDVTDGTYPLSVTLTPGSTSSYLLCIAHIYCGKKDDTKDRTNVVLSSTNVIVGFNVTEEEWKQGKIDGTYASNTTW